MSEQLNPEVIMETFSAQKVKIAVADGDGIGPEIMDATLRILEAAGANIEAEHIQIGEKVYLSGNSSGIPTEAWEVINRNKIMLKAPITTPQGKGYKSLNVTLRKSLNLYANIRPCRSLHPFVQTMHPDMDVVIVRENEEDLYAGIEHQQTHEVVQCLKLISIPGSERIIREAFEYAVANDRQKVTCMVKDNIMKLTDGVFHEIFNRIGAEYPQIEQEVQIIDIGAARLATRPDRYDVVVTLNLYGDIISDITAELTGSVGMAGSSNIGKNYAMFEAIHGSAPDIAGKGIANPSGLLNAAVMMLQHIGDIEVAQKISNAWLCTLEDGVHTGDIFNPEFSTKRVNTAEFADAVIERLGKLPQKLKPVHFVAAERHAFSDLFDPLAAPVEYGDKELVGVDIFLDRNNRDPKSLGDALRNIKGTGLQLKMITNRGVKVYPDGNPETFCTDHWRCRYIAEDIDLSAGVIYKEVAKETIIRQLSVLLEQGFDVVKTENLYHFGDKRGFSLGQGE
ncbi:MAG: NADP-dependent isocitrate dehydrogenase [Flavobacteriales bacterium]|nr:NADP-dependent isocitrate dehydrogenase [Flavobacteriales bacterium]